MKALVITACLITTLPSFARSDCPTTQFLTGSQGFGQSEVVDAPEGSLGGGAVLPGVPCIACFSWPYGYFRTSGNTGTDWASSVESHERFELVGPATPDPVTFSARIRVTGSVQMYGQGSAGIGEGSEVTQVLTVEGGESVSDVPLVLPLQHFAGEPFDIYVRVAALSLTHPWVAIDMQAAFEFMNLPAGWSIASCRHVEVPVPVRPMTWGSLRALYR